jgi:hypothetical protein
MATIRTFDFSLNLLRAILWQYNDAENQQALLTAKESWYTTNQQEFWENWITDVFDLRTCNEFGLVVWAIILGIPLSYIIPPQPNDTTPWGFDTYNPTNFLFYNFSADAATPVEFTLEERRLILQLRYRQITNRPTVPNLNKILYDLLVPNYGPMIAIDAGNMVQRISTSRALPANILTILTELDILPRGAGVLLEVVVAGGNYFGFGSETAFPNTNQNFNNGALSPN